MNNIYRVVWNASIGIWIVVSEKAKAKSKTKSTSVNAVITAALVLGFSGDVFAAASSGGVGTGTVISSLNCNKAATANSVGGIAIGCNAESGADSGILDRQNPYNNSTTANTNNINWSTGFGPAGGTTAIGSYSEASGGLSTAIGTNAKATDIASIAMGVAAISTGNTSLAIGRQSAATADYAQAIGNVAAATGKGTLAIGHSATATGYRAIAIGSPDIENAANVGNGQKGNGYQTEGQTIASAKDSIAFGGGAQATKENALAIGAFAESSGEKSVAIGTGAKATANNAVVIGEGAMTSVVGGVALGMGAKVKGENSAAVGLNSVAESQAGLSFLTNVAATSQGTVSFGNASTKRRLTNLADGALDSDAVTVAQLKFQKEQIDRQGNDTAKFFGGDAIYNSSTGGITQPTYIINKNLDGSGGITVNNVGAAITNVDNRTTVLENQTWKLQANSDADTAIAADTTVSFNNGKNIKIGRNGTDITIATAEDADFNTITVGGAAGIALNGTTKKISGLADGVIGVNSTEAINGSQLYATNSILENVANSTKNILGGNATLNANGKLSVTNIGGTGKDNIDDAIQASKTEVVAGSNIGSVDKSQGTNGQDIYTVNAKGTIASAGSKAVTVTSSAKSDNITDYSVDLSQEAKENLMKADTALQTVVTQIDGKDVKTVNKDDNKVNFINGDNVALTANADGSITIGTKADVTFNNVSTTNLTATGATKLGDHFTVNKGGSYYTGPITEGNHITNKTYVDRQTASAKSEVVAGSNITNIVKSQGTNGQDIYTVNAKGTIASAGSKAVTITSLAKSNNLTDYVVDLSQETKDSLAKADNALHSFVTQIDGKDVKTVNKDDNKVNFINGDNVALTANADGSITIGTKSDVTFNNVSTTNLTATGETKLGNHFTVNKGGSYYTGPIIDSDHITNKAYVDGKTASAKTEVEQGKNIQVSSSIGDDGQTIYTVATKDNVDFSKVNVGNTTITSDGLSIVDGPSLTVNGVDAGGKKVANVEDGEISPDSKEAINGSQLYALGDKVTQIFGGNASYINNQITWSNIGGTGLNTIDDAIKYVNDQATNANQGWSITTDSGAGATSTVKPKDNVTITGDTANGVSVTNTGNQITVGLGNKITVGSGENSVFIDGSKATVEVGNVKIDGSTGTITAGQVTVNGTAGTVNGLTNTTWDADHIVSGQAATEDQLKQVAQNASEAAAAAKSTVTAGENITVSTTKNSDGSTHYQVATNKDVKFDSVTATTVNSDKISVGNVTIDQTGIHAGNNKISNVADGAVTSTSKDAVNGSQLYTSNHNIYNYLGGGANYETNTGPTYNVAGGTQTNVGDALNALDNRDHQLDQKITNLGDQLQQSFYQTNQRIDDVEKKANAGIAAAMALESAPFIPSKWTYAAGAAYHGGENAIGITLRKTSDNGRWSVTGGFAAASQGDPSFRLGISGVID